MKAGLALDLIQLVIFFIALGAGGLAVAMAGYEVGKGECRTPHTAEGP